MSLFSKFVGKKDVQTTVNTSAENNNRTVKYADSSSIVDDERPYYQADSYYTLIAHEGTPFERKVVTFDDRKKISYPSRTGLYVAEILLLEYCSYGTYPKPKMGYPGFWWFEYGIRDVGHALESLAERGYIEFDNARNTIQKYTVPELKTIAQKYGISVSGKKAAILDAVLSGLSDEQIESEVIDRKYVLTEKGKAELEENAYVPYMHKHKNKTVEDATFGEPFNVWGINKMLKGEDVPKWKEIVGTVEEMRFGVNLVGIESLEPETSTSEDVKAFLKSEIENIQYAAKSGGDGYKEEMKGLAFKKAGRDKDALYYFYISILKGFDAPALYTATLDLLKKYGLKNDAIGVCRAALKNLPDAYHSEIQERMKQFEAL